jgi:hypothetical protein
LDGVELFEPQPTRIRPTASNSAAVKYFMNIHRVEIPKGALTSISFH